MNPSADAAEATLLLVRAFELLSAEAARQDELRALGVDPFAEPEAPATAVFVNELRCQGRSCTSCCVDKAPEVFQFAEDTGAARAQPYWSLSGGKEYVMRVAVGQCPTECIHWVTPLQREILDAELLRCALCRAQAPPRHKMLSAPRPQQSAGGASVARRGGRDVRGAARSRALRERARARRKAHPQVLHAVRGLVLKHTHTHTQRGPAETVLVSKACL